jgi:predicted transcriptional regulator
MEALYRLGKASASEIHDAIPEPPTYTAVRTLLGILESKGHVRFEADGRRYIYQPVVPREQMARTVIDDVVQTFFQGSIESVVANLLNREESNVSEEQLDALAALIEQARKEGR